MLAGHEVPVRAKSTAGGSTWRCSRATSKVGSEMRTLLRAVLHPPAGPWDPQCQEFRGFLLYKHGGVSAARGCMADGDSQAMGRAGVRAQGWRLGRSFALLI